MGRDPRRGLGRDWRGQKERNNDERGKSLTCHTAQR